MPNAETPKSQVLRKLVCFFEKSRNQWKAKHHQIKRVLKRSQNRVRVLEKRVEQGMSRAEALEAEVVRLRAREQALVRKIETLKTRETEGPQCRKGGWLCGGALPSCV
jgi:septal ring factor EnvC (AmiA/AmiB activator)